MSGSFRDFYSRPRNPFMDEDDGSYRAWEPCAQGDAINLKFVPARSASRYSWQVPYLQPITIRHDQETDQLCLLCHSTGTTVILEGRGLELLGDLIAEKRVKLVRMFDPDLWPEPGNESPMVRKISIEHKENRT